MNIRPATEADLPRVNELRAQVSALHASGRPDFFKPGFPEKLEELIHDFYRDEHRHILVAEREGTIVGFALLTEHDAPESPYKAARRFIEVGEFGVDDAYRRQGIGRALFEGIAALAKERGFEKIELNVWEFNQEALSFYEAIGLTTYRRYMEYRID